MKLLAVALMMCGVGLFFAIVASPQSPPKHAPIVAVQFGRDAVTVMTADGEMYERYWAGWAEYPPKRTGNFWEK